MAYVNQSRKRTEIDFRGLICNSLNIQVSFITRFLLLNPAPLTSLFVLLYCAFINKYHLCVPCFAGMGFDFNAAAFPFPHESHTSVVPNIFSLTYPSAA
jgi:hypothetical protein